MMSKSPKCLRMSHSMDLDRSDCLEFLLRFCLGVIATFTLVVISMGLFRVLSLNGLLIALVCVVLSVSISVSLQYNSARNKMYYFADFPIEPRLRWMMVMVTIGVFPAVIYSSLQLKKQRRSMAASDGAVRRELKLSSEAQRKYGHSTDYFPLELTTLMRRYCSKQWQLSHPDDTDPDEETLENLEYSAGALLTNPEVWAVAPQYDYGSGEISYIDIKLRIADEPSRPHYFLGDYTLRLTANWRDSTLKCVMSGMTANFRRMCEICKTDFTPWVGEFSSCPKIIAMMDGGNVSGAINLLISWLREKLLSHVDCEGIGCYFLPMDD